MSSDFASSLPPAPQTSTEKLTNELKKDSTAILLVNLGSPKTLSFFSVMSFIAKFLSDRRVVELPRLLWWVVLAFFILPFRTPRTLKLYRKIWTSEGSPLRVLTEKLTNNLSRYVTLSQEKDCVVLYAMTYGNPSVKEALKKIERLKATRLIVLPLFPQYSGTSTGAVFDKVVEGLKLHRYLPSMHFINYYYHEAIYLEALADSIRALWQKVGPTERILFSFHGLPERNIHRGDPYRDQCEHTARAVVKILKIPENICNFSFHSRLGWRAWTGPNTTTVLTDWAKEGVKSVTVISPSFAVDCLETLEELDIQNRNHFLNAGGECYHYVRALNDTDTHVMVLASILGV